MVLARKLYKEIYWRSVLWKRSAAEYIQRFKINDVVKKHESRPYVVYMTGMPRTGSSYMKNYLGAYDRLTIMPFEPKGFHKTWELSLKKGDSIYIDKSTHYIRHLRKIFATCGGHVSVCCIVRDPRDQLASLFDFDRHPELPRSCKFWDKWYAQYNGFLEFAKKNSQYNFFLLRYEDLVRSPVEAKQCFLNWIDLNADPHSLSSSYTVAHKNDIQDDKVTVRNTSSDEGIGRFLRVTGPERVKVIEEYKRKPEVLDLMGRFGYLPSFSDSLPENFINITINTQAH